MNTTFTSTDKPLLNVSPIDDLKQAASKMLGAERRSFEAAMALKYCQGNARQAELLFGWSRHSVELGLPERRSGVICLGVQAAFCGNKWWEEKHLGLDHHSGQGRLLRLVKVLRESGRTLEISYPWKYRGTRFSDNSSRLILGCEGIILWAFWLLPCATFMN